MIISASRRTDIPRFFFDWFLNRLKEGYALVRNPINARQVSRVALNPEVVDCIVFWSKNPAPMLERLRELEPYPYYVQFTLHPYGKDVECALPPKRELLNTFIKLSNAVGPERVVWRYSPVLYTKEYYTQEFHVKTFRKLARALNGYTAQCKLSFLDMYAKIKKRMSAMGISEGDALANAALAREMAAIAAENGIELSACGNIDPAAGLPPAKCIDDELISRISGYSYNLKKDAGQRGDCYCVASADIGAYDTCGNSCQYCYANFSAAAVKNKVKLYDPHSPMLCDALKQDDVLTERTAKSNRVMQRSLFDRGNGQ